MILLDAIQFDDSKSGGYDKEDIVRASLECLRRCLPHKLTTTKVTLKCKDSDNEWLSKIVTQFNSAPRKGIFYGYPASDILGEIQDKNQERPDPKPSEQEWMILSARAQNVAKQFQLLKPNGAADPSMFKEDLDVINGALEELVRCGDLVEKKIDLLPAEKLGDKGFESLYQFTESISDSRHGQTPHNR